MQQRTLLTKQKGFTIIEVVLVLAIAGLIFLIVFLALPQLQQSRRNTQRRNDVSRVLAALETYAGDNDGRYPANQTQLTAFQNTYLRDGFADPTAGVYELFATPISSSSIPGTPTSGAIRYSLGMVCASNNYFTTTGANSRSVAVGLRLEGSGQPLHCDDMNRD